MTQPRGQQIKSVNTRYDVLRVSITPGTDETVIASGSFPVGPGGADQDVPARVRGIIISPFAVLPGYTMSIRVDGAPAFNVVFASTDTTVGRICLKINTAAGSNIASNDAGHLVLTSPTLGSSSSLILADVTPGTLSVLGLIAGTYAGTDAGTDGIVTLSPDGLGGIAPHSTEDGRNLVTDGGKLVYFSHINGFSTGRRMMQIIPGGTPVIGRLTFDGTSYHSKYYAKLTPRAKVRSLGAFFSLLDGSNTVTLNVNGQGFNTTFSGGPYTRDLVLDAINAAYAAAMGITDPWARVDGTSPSPFRGLNGTSFKVEVDGGSPQTISFTTESTAAEVAGHITSSLTGASASVVTGPNGQYVAIRSTNTNGRTSSLKIYSGDQSLFRLGIRPGFYGGSYIADQYGPDEIEIASAYRGDGNGGFPSLSVSGSGTTLVRMGLSAVTLPGGGASQYEPVTAPFFDAAMSSSPFFALMCFPDVLEFGDVPIDTDVIIQQYLAKSAGSNIDERNRIVDDAQSGKISTPPASRGFFDVGKPVVTGSDGQIPFDGGDANAVDAIIKQITRLSATEVVQAVVGSVFETPGNGSNPLPTQPFMDFYADPTDAYATRGFRMKVSPSAVGISAVDDAAGSTPLLRSYLGVHGARSIYFPDDSAKISDPNIASADPTNGYMLITSTGDNYLSVGGGLAIPGRPNVIGYNLLRSVNARYEVYLGDGSTTTGDFNGPDALSQAIAFLTAASIFRCRIIMKPGAYVENSPTDVSSFSDITIEASHPYGDGAATTLHCGFPGSIITTVSGHLSSFIFKGIGLTAFDTGSSILSVNAGYVLMKDCSSTAPVSFLDPILLKLERCYFSNDQASTVVVSFDNDSLDTVQGISMVDCVMSSGQDAPIVAILDNTTFTRVAINLISLEGCSFAPGNATFTGVNPTNPTARVFSSQRGAGIISIIPTRDAYTLGGTSGLIVQDLEILSTKVNLGETGTTTDASYVALNLVPSGPQGNITWGYGVNPAFRMNNVRVEDMDIAFPPGSLAQQMQSPCICIGGVGIPPFTASSVGNASVGTLTVKRVHINVENAIHGPATVNMLPFFNNYSSTSSGDSTQAGLMCLSGQNVVAEDLSFTNTVDFSGSPELFAVGYAHLNVRGFETRPVAQYGTNTLLTLTNARLYVRDVFGATINVRDVYMDGAGQFDAHWGNNALLVIEGGSAERVGTIISDFVIQGFFFAFAVPAILIKVATGHATWPTNTQGGGVLLERGYLGNHGIGSAASNGPTFGIEAFVTNSSTFIDNVHVKNVTIDSIAGNGILLSVRPITHSMSVKDCHISLCGNVNGAGGIKMSTQNLAATTPTGGMIVKDNIVQMNNVPSGSGYDGIQINIRDTGSIHRPTQASVYNNNCYDNVNSSYGKINSCVNANTNLPGVGYYLSVNVQVFGLETGYTGQTGSFATFGNGYLWSPPFRCMHNNAALNADFSNGQ